jgi:hypothetical protein
MKHTAIGSGDVSCFLFILSILALLRNRKIYNNNDFYILAMHFAGIMLLDVETNIYNEAKYFSASLSPGY